MVPAMADCCVEFLGEVILGEGPSPRVLERLLCGLKELGEQELGGREALKRALLAHVESVLEDVIDGRDEGVVDLVWLIQLLQRACETQVAEPGVDRAGFAPSLEDVHAQVHEAVVRRLGHLTSLAQAATVVGVAGPGGPSFDG